MKRAYLWIAVVCLVTIAAAPALAQIYVDAGATGANNGTSWTAAFTSLQSALLSALAGDEIWVAAGTYKPTTGTDRTVKFEIYSQVALYGGFGGTELLREQRDPASNVTILSGAIGTPDSTDNSAHVVYSIASAPTTVLDGFTITGGYASGADDSGNENGGGIALINSFITVTDVIVERNTAKRWGGGLYIEGGAPDISNAIVRHNSTGITSGSTTWSGTGGGIFAHTSTASFTDVTIAGNFCNANNQTSHGMRIYLGAVTMTDCLFDANLGVGLYSNSTSVFTRVTFTRHPLRAMVSADSVTMYDCTFIDNYAGGLSASDDLLNDCLFSGNSGTYGSGLHTYENTPVLNNVTFINNTASISGGAVYCPRSNIELNNVRFIGNSANVGGAMYTYGWAGYDPPRRYGPRMRNVVFTGNHATSQGGAIRMGSQVPYVEMSNVTIVGNSCDGEGAAIYNYYGEGTIGNTIIWGNEGLSEVFVEGHFELNFSNSLVAGSGGSGAGWDTAIGIDGGGNLDTDPWLIDESGGDLRLSLWSPCINAGDNGAAPGLLPTDIAGNPRIEDGIVDMGAWEFKCGSPGPVVYVDADATGDGDGTSWTDAATSLRLGLGIACGGVEEIWVAEGTYTPTDGDDLTSTFLLNSGIGVYGGFDGTETSRSQRHPGTNPTILSGRILVGGVPTGCYHVVTGTGADPTAILDGFVVEGAAALGAYPDDRGAGMINFPGSPTVTGVIFRDNMAINGGGGMYNHFGSAPVLTNVSFDGNTSGTTFGGGMYNLLANATIVNGTFANNAGYNSGGAIFNNGGAVTITNTIVYGNTPAPDQVFNLSGSPLVSHSLIEGCGGSGDGWNPATGTDGGGNIDDDPLFLNAAGGDLRLHHDSPAIDVGDETVPGLPGTDLDGNARIFGVTVDMGAYEYWAYLVGADDTPAPANTQLGAPWPNPFNPTVTIDYELAEPVRVTLSVYDVAGRLVETLVDESRPAGRHAATWNGVDRSGNRAASGVYLVVLRAGGRTDHRKITLLK